MVKGNLQHFRKGRRMLFVLFCFVFIYISVLNGHGLSATVLKESGGSFCFVLFLYMYLHNFVGNINIYVDGQIEDNPYRFADYSW